MVTGSFTKLEGLARRSHAGLLRKILYIRTSHRTKTICVRLSYNIYLLLLFISAFSIIKHETSIRYINLDKKLKLY